FGVVARTSPAIVALRWKVSLLKETLALFTSRSAALWLPPKVPRISPVGSVTDVAAAGAASVTAETSAAAVVRERPEKFRRSRRVNMRCTSRLKGGAHYRRVYSRKRC